MKNLCIMIILIFVRKMIVVKVNSEYCRFVIRTKEGSLSTNNDNEIEAYGKVSSNTEVTTSKIQFANGNNLYDNRWDYSINYDEANKDSAIGIVWDDINIESGEKKVLSTCYGVRNVDETPKDDEDNDKEDNNNKEENNKQEDNKGNENLKDVIEQAKVEVSTKITTDKEEYFASDNVVISAEA